MRAKLISHDVVECVLGLGPNLFYNSPMEACVVICRMKKPKEKLNKILFINAVNEVTRERAQSFLTDNHINKIREAYHAFKSVKGFCQVADVFEVQAKENSLNIAVYVANAGNGGERKSSKPTESVKQAASTWFKSSMSLRKSMTMLFKKIGISSAIRGRK
jgi:type I restriction enzyme M protein